MCGIPKISEPLTTVAFISSCGGGLFAKSCLTLGTPWTVAHQALLPIGFPSQEYWSGMPFPSPGDISDPEIKLVSPELAGRFFTTEPPECPGQLLELRNQHLNIVK